MSKDRNKLRPLLSLREGDWPHLSQNEIKGYVEPLLDVLACSAPPLSPLLEPTLSEATETEALL